MESIAKVSSLLEAARELTLEASRDASASRRAARPLAPAQLQKLLDSRQERDVLEGLRRVVSMQQTSALSATLPYFPAVLKTLSHTTSSTRPLVYIYLVHHAEADPDTALLAINTIQKSLSDSNPRVRALALKTMSAIRVPLISQIVSLAIKKGIADMAPTVRRAAAFACVKCVRLDPTTLPQATDYLSQLIGDQQYVVAGAAVAALMEICPERIDLVHKHYRGLVKKLVDMDEWGQLATLRLLTVYARKCFPYRTRRAQQKVNRSNNPDSFYEDTAVDRESSSPNDEVPTEQVLDPDLELFLDAALPLLQSRTSAVVVQVAQTYFSLSPGRYLQHAIGPLVALLRSSADIKLIALHNIVQVALQHPAFFVAYYRHFTLQTSDAPQIFQLKLELLTLIFPHCSADNQSLTLAELEHFSRSPSPAIVRDSVRAIGRCAQCSTPSTSSRCLRLLLRQVHAADHTLVAEALDVIRHLVQQDPIRHRRTIIRLAKDLDALHNSDRARASVIWLVGEFAGLEGRLDVSIAPDVLRILLRGYADESDEVRAQIVLLAAKVYLLWLNEQKASQPDPPTDAATTDDSATADTPHQEQADQAAHPTELLWQHTLLLARYTPSYDLRDRARMFRALLSTPSSTELASLLLLAPKPVPQAPSPSETRKGLELGTATLVVGRDAGSLGLKGYESLPEWVSSGDEPDARLRDTSDRVEGSDRTAAGSAGRMLEAAVKNSGRGSDYAMEKATRAGLGPVTSAKEKTLEGWLAESDAEEDEGDESEESESDEETDDDEETSGSGEYETDEEEDDQDDDSDLDANGEHQRLVKT